MNKYNKDSMDQLLESYFKMVGEAHIDNLAEKYTAPQTERSYNLIDQLDDDKILTAIKKEVSTRQHKVWYKRFFSSMPNIAIVVFAIIIIFAMSLTVEAFRIKVFNLFINETDSYIDIQREDNEEKELEVTGIDNYYYPEYIPQGYELVEIGDYMTSLDFTFSDGVSNLYMTQQTGEISIGLDNEDVVIKEISINQFDGYLTISEDTIFIVFFTDTHSIELFGNLSEKEIIEIAENIIFID